MNISLQLLKRILSREKSYIPSFLLLGVIGLAISTAVISALYHDAKEAKDGLATTGQDRDNALGALQKELDHDHR